MTRPIHVADPDIHPFVLEALDVCPELRVQESPKDAAALVTKHVDIDRPLIDAVGSSLEAIFVLEPGSATIAGTRVPVHAVENPALIGVAEHAVLLMLALAKKLPRVLDQTRRGEWAPGMPKPTLTNQTDYAYNWIDLGQFGSLSGRTVGLVGLGYIGLATARMLRAFSANVIYHKRTRLPLDDETALGVEWRSLGGLLEESDFVSLHHRFVEGPDGNDGQFGADAFRRMKPTACFVNTARGRLVDEDALFQALESAEIAGAALDVFRYEPLPADHPFFRVNPDTLIITPHLAGLPMRDAADTVTRRIAATLSHT